jgi:hypothetical protein
MLTLHQTAWIDEADPPGVFTDETYSYGELLDYRDTPNRAWTDEIDPPTKHGQMRQIPQQIMDR